MSTPYSCATAIASPWARAGTGGHESSFGRARRRGLSEIAAARFWFDGWQLGGRPAAFTTTSRCGHRLVTRGAGTCR